MPRKKKSAIIENISPEALRKMLNKEFGAGTAMLASDPSLQITRIPTGVLPIDYMLSGGFPRNRFIELYGSESVGKTTLALKCAAQAQKMGLLAAYVDCENSFDPEFTEHIGVDIKQLDYHPQKSGELCVRYMETLLYANLHGVIILDSIASLLPEQEKNATMEAGSMGMEQAKLMSRSLRRLTTANKSTVVIFINQLRDAIGVTFGKKTTTPGGRAMPQYAGIRIEMVRTETLKKSGRHVNEKTGEVSEKDLPSGHRVLCRVSKDKTGSASKPFEETSFVFDYEKADIDDVESLIYVGRLTDYIHKDGDKWWVDGYEDEVQNGRPKFRKWLRKNRAVREELEEWILFAEPESEEDDEDE